MWIGHSCVLPPNTQECQWSDRNQNAGQAGSRKARAKWPWPLCGRLRARVGCPKIVFPQGFRLRTDRRRQGSKKSFPNRYRAIQFHIQILQCKSFTTALSTVFQRSEISLAKRARGVTINGAPLCVSLCLFKLKMVGRKAQYSFRKKFRYLKGELRYLCLWVYFWLPEAIRAEPISARNCLYQ